MPMKIPNAAELEIITAILTPALTLRLYSNNKTPADGDTAAAYTEVIGGNYANTPLVFANWNITSGTPTSASYNAVKQWIFNGPVGGPNTIYGYYVTRNSDGLLQWAERFPSTVVPFSPINGSKIVILPKYTVESLF
jgi:hypothetical protein